MRIGELIVVIRGCSKGRGGEFERKGETVEEEKKSGDGR
jgi:hypothetical protein